MSMVNLAIRKPVKPPPKEVTGVSEQYHNSLAVPVNSSTFENVVLDDRKDVLLLLYAPNCEPCTHLAPYFRKLVERFRDLAIPSLVVARMSVENDFPPVELGLEIKSLPTVIFFPADAKKPPYRCGDALPADRRQPSAWTRF
jgi:thioredoxin-like negative regulator of GroEL